jgi:hypothetical protein
MIVPNHDLATVGSIETNGNAVTELPTGFLQHQRHRLGQLVALHMTCSGRATFGTFDISEHSLGIRGVRHCGRPQWPGSSNYSIINFPGGRRKGACGLFILSQR